MVFGSGNDFPPALPSFPFPVVAPDVDPDAGSQMTVCFAAEWLPVLIGAMQQLTLQATWQGDNTAVLLAQSRAQTLIAMFGAADGGCDQAIALVNLRYNSGTDSIQQTFDGGTTWVDNPSLDPRTSTLYRLPPNTATDQRCQAAANDVRFISDLIGNVLVTIDAAGTAEGLIAILLPFFVELGPFGILIDLVLGLAFVLFAAGSTAIAAAFTNTVYDQLLCIFDCNLSLDGSCTPAQLTAIENAISTDIGGLVNDVMQAMLFLMGDVGLSNAGATGSAPADCSGCSCNWCYTFDFTASDGGWVARGGTDAQYLAGQGWSTVAPGGSDSVYCVIDRTFTLSTLTEISMVLDYNKGGLGGSPPVEQVILRNAGSAYTYYSNTSPPDGTPLTVGWTGSQAENDLEANVWTTNDRTHGAGFCIIRSITLHGTGSNPFGSDNC